MSQVETGNIIKMNKHKAFTLLELLIASTLFVITIVGVIVLISTVTASMSKSLATKDLNDTIRNINTKLLSTVEQAKCVKAESGTVVNLYSDNCQNKVGRILIKDNNLLVSDIANEVQLNPDNINVIASGKNDMLGVVDDNMLKVNIGFSADAGNGKNIVQFQTAYITGRK